MQNNSFSDKSRQYLQTLCETIPGRCVGSEGNRQATHFFKTTLEALGWQTRSSEFEAMDWQTRGAELIAEGLNFEVFSSPYSPGCDVKARLLDASTLQELEKLKMEDAIVLLHGEIAAEQLMPKNFVFYNPDHHQKIVSCLESGKPAAIITATGFNPELAGGVYPFPMIEDGDFDIPSVFMTEEEGERLLAYSGKVISLKSDAERIQGNGFNVAAIKGKSAEKRIVVTAHIDAKKGTPGAIDNATGVIVLLLLAEMLADYSGDTQVELVAFNGEDYYAVPGQMLYISENQGLFDQILLNINIDGAGYYEGISCFSLFSLPSGMETRVKAILSSQEHLTEGPEWPQGDHSIFVQFGRPAIAFTSKWFLDNMSTQRITHTPSDHPRIVNHQRLIEIAAAISQLVKAID